MRGSVQHFEVRRVSATEEVMGEPVLEKVSDGFAVNACPDRADAHISDASPITVRIVSVLIDGISLATVRFRILEGSSVLMI